LPTREWAARVEAVEKTYRTSTSRVRALKGVTATFPRAALSAVVGPSGSGKSSLLRLVSGIDRPTAGTIEIGSARLDRARERTLRRIRRGSVGYVFQRPSDNFVSYLTVGEHLRLAARSASRPWEVNMVRLLDDLGISHRIDHLPSELSGGEQQRAAFAQVLASGADVVVADEPTAELDDHSARGLLGRVRALVEDGFTFILATHDRGVMRLADDVLELDHGVVKPRRRPEAASGLGWSASARTRGGPGAAPPSSSATPVLEVRRVSRSYRRGEETVHAVENASLTLREGEVVGLIGRSGSGKTTLLSLISGWEPPDGGRIEWADGRPMKVYVPWKDLAVVPQRLGLMDSFTVRENVEYPARLGDVLDERRDTVDELLGALGLGELQHRYPSEISVGEQQRAALARALVLSPRLLLADEPTGHQDRATMERVFAAMRRAAEEGTSCLIATHDEEAASRLDRVISMADGRVRERDTEPTKEHRREEHDPADRAVSVPEESPPDDHERWRRPPSDAGA
jgi:putative ABC transport system ATP-binding protein